MIQVEAGSASAVVTLGVIVFEGLRLERRVDALDEAMAAAERATRLRPPAAGVAVRRMYSRVGLDPTRRRPSSEALLRRVLRGEPMPRINPLVDVCNWCSMELQLPYGLYDLARVEGDLRLRLGAPGEQYAGIGKDAVHVEGRLVLADRLGPFGNPSSDSARTMVTASTRRALAVVFAPAELGEVAVAQALELTSNRAKVYAGADESRRAVVPARGA